MQITFNNLDSARHYLKGLKYFKKDSFVCKNERAYIYKHQNKKKYVYLSSKVDYINKDTMDRGVVWKLETL